MSGDRCPHGECDGSGYVVDQERRVATPCRCRPMRIARAKAAALEARIPKRYQGVSLDREPVRSMPRHVIASVRGFVGQVGAELDRGRGLWFTGPPGTGKTTLAMLVSVHAIRADRTVAIYSLPRLLALLRATFDDSAAESLPLLIERLCSVDLLHIDDVGAEQSSPWVLEQLYTIINTRYEDERSVVITTNLDHEALRDQIGERTVSRLAEMCELLPLHGEDHRMGYQPEDRPEAAPTPFAPGRYGDLGFGSTRRA